MRVWKKDIPSSRSHVFSGLGFSDLWSAFNDQESVLVKAMKDGCFARTEQLSSVKVASPTLLYSANSREPAASEPFPEILSQPRVEARQKTHRSECRCTYIVGTDRSQAIA